MTARGRLGMKAVHEGGQGEIVEKKSRFIATVRPVESEEAAMEFIAEMKKKILGRTAQLLGVCRWKESGAVPLL